MVIKNIIDRYYRTQFQKNIIRSSIVFGINTLFIFISYPVYIHYLGVELFAIWSLLAIIISFAELGNFGIGNAIVTYVAEEKVKGNSCMILSYFSNSVYIILFSFIIIVPVFLLLGKNLCQLVGIPASYFDMVIPMLPFLIVIVFQYLLNDILKAVLTGIGRLDLSNILFVGSNVLKLFIAIICFLFGMQLWGMLLSICIANFCLSIIYTMILYKSGLYLAYFQSYRYDIVKRLISYGGKMIGIQILNMLMMPVCKIFLARINLSSVTYFEIASKVVYAIRGVFEKGIYAILPKVSEMIATNVDSRCQIRLLNKRIAIRMMFFVIPTSVILGIFSPFWMKWWLVSKYDSSISICFNIIQVGMLVGLYALPYYYSYLGIGKENLCFKEALIRVLLNVSLVFLLSILSIDNPLWVYIIFSFSTVISNIYILSKADS